VVADPPYSDIRPDVIERLGVHVKPGGVFVLSWPSAETVRELAGLDRVAVNPLGDITLVFYKKIG